MPTDNVLIQITTAANMAGVEQAKAGMLGLNASTLALGAALGGLILAGKSAIEIAEQQAKAHANLAQAVKVTGGDIAATDKYLQQFIDSNRRYLTSQSEVEDNYGALLRLGIPVAEAQKDLNRAVDLAALKSKTLTEATDLLIRAEQGRFKGLIDLGISTGKYTDAQGNLINGTKDVRRAMDDLDPKLKDGRKTYTELDQATKSLGITWQQFATSGGAADQLIRAFTNAIQIGDLFMQFLQKMGAGDNPIWGAIDDRLSAMARWIHDYIIAPMQWFQNWSQGGILMPNQSAPFGIQGPGAPSGGGGGRASGGPVMPGQSYSVGESAIERLTMFPGGGGYVTPISGRSSPAGNITINITNPIGGDGPYWDRIANQLALRLGYATGR